MLYTPHFLTGASILKLIPNPYIGLPLALVSHLMLDLIPHNDFDLKPGITLKEFMKEDPKRRNRIIGVLAGDYLLTGIAVLWLFMTYKNIFLVLGGTFGVLPDLVEQFLMLFGIPLPGWQDKIQWRVSAKYGFISYPIVSIIAIYLLIK